VPIASITSRATSVAEYCCWPVIRAWVRERDEQAKRQAAEAERELAVLRKSAAPVTTVDVDPALRFTLAQAAERIDQAGGKIELRRDRLVVCLPPGAGKMYGTEPLDAARVLYLAEPAVVALLAKGEALPDAPITPAGAVLA
jgi:hypothetical protein